MSWTSNIFAPTLRQVNILTFLTVRHIFAKNLYFFHNRSAIKTLSKESGFKAKEIRKIKTRTLNDIIENSPYKNKQINYLSIDVEGHELSVLNGFDLNKYKPELIIIEFIDPVINDYYLKDINNVLDSTIYKIMDMNNYKLVNWVHAVLIFVPRNNMIK